MNDKSGLFTDSEGNFHNDKAFHAWIAVRQNRVFKMLGDADLPVVCVRCSYDEDEAPRSILCTCVMGCDNPRCEGNPWNEPTHLESRQHG